MSSVYTMKRIWLQKDKKAYQAWRELMEKAELQTTEALDYTVGIYDDTALIASGSLAKRLSAWPFVKNINLKIC